MSQPQQLIRCYSRPRRGARRRHAWPDPEENRLRLSPRAHTEADWGRSAPSMEQESSVEIRQGYAAAIALLRSLRNVDQVERQKQREAWEMLEQDLDEGRYH